MAPAGSRNSVSNPVRCNVQNLAWNLFNRSLAALAAGDLDVALATAQESCELLQDMEPGPYSGAAAAALASALLETGRPTGASTCCSREPAARSSGSSAEAAGAIP